jgi:diguanylate cyclase (GGDEF)-like protein/PAS domain S-box-containing protein
MQIPFSLARSFVSGRHYSQKLLLGGALLVLSICLVLAIQFVSGLRAGMVFKDKELLGLEYIGQVRILIESVQQHRAFSGAYLSGDSSAKYLIAEKQALVDRNLAALDSMNARTGRDLDTNSRVIALTLKWDAIRNGGLKLGVKDNFAQHSLLVEEFAMLLTHVAYASGLAVDPDTDSYYLVDTMVNRLPVLIEHMGQIRGLGAGILVRRTISETETAQIMAQQTLINDALPRISDNVDKLLGADALPQETVGRLPRDLVETTLVVHDLVQNHVLALGDGLTPRAFYEQASTPIETGFRLFDAAAPALEQLLKSRREQLARNLNWGLLVAVVLLLVGGYLFVGIYRYTTERQLVHDQLRLAAQVFEHSREAIFVTDKQKNIISVNRAFTEITGYVPEEVLGKNPSIWNSGLQDAEFYRKLHTAIEEEGYWHGEIWNKRKNGEIFPEWLSISAIRNEKGEITNYLRISTDISGRKKDEERLQFLANYDALTSLPNRSMFVQRLNYALTHANRYNKQLAVLFIDLDRFKLINDTLGHDAGDLLLKDAAGRLRGCLRESDTVARLGGDEFVVLLTEFSQNRDVVGVAKKILETMASPFLLGGHECHITASIGISSFPGDSKDYQTLLKNADIAMYRAKEQGKNNFQFYSAQMNVDSFDRLALESSLRRALERNEFLLHYQPKVDIDSGNITGMEALVRWQHPDMGMVSPAQFIPLAEETGLIVPLGEWVLKSACTQNREWQKLGFPRMRVAVNLSPRQFRQKHLVREVARILSETGLDAGSLELEITESMVMHNPEQAAKVLTELRTMGIYLSIDDFGTGYSSLAYLKRFPINCIKIDRSFIQDLPHDADNAAITRAIIAIADSLKLNVIAEGVENEEQMDFLREHKCTEIQGYYFSRPLPPQEFAAMLPGPRADRKKSPPLRLIAAVDRAGRGAA